MTVRLSPLDRQLREMSEKELLQNVRSLAKLFDYLTYHTFTSVYSEKGFPDLTMVRPGRVIFAELKSQLGKLTEDQTKWIAALRANGAEAYVWRPSDWVSGEIEEVLRGHK